MLIDFLELNTYEYGSDLALIGYILIDFYVSVYSFSFVLVNINYNGIFLLLWADYYFESLTWKYSVYYVWDETNLLFVLGNVIGTFSISSSKNDGFYLNVYN